MRQLGILVVLIGLCLPFKAHAFGEEEFSVHGYFQLQSGVFVPLTSSLFKDYDNTAYLESPIKGYLATDLPCDPVRGVTSCWPTDHGGKAGTLSMMRATAQLEADWHPAKKINLHAILRASRALELPADDTGIPPVDIAPSDRRAWIANNFYNEFDLREFYLDFEATRWLSFRLGRQQVTWGTTGQYRLLDVINPIDNTWHFGPLESFQDTRIPLWIGKALIDFYEIDHSLEIVWVPGIDRNEDSVTPLLTYVGAWGLPPTNTPSPAYIAEKRFDYPNKNLTDSRIGFRWHGNLSPKFSYSLVYYYGHQLSPPIPRYIDWITYETQDFDAATQTLIPREYIRLTDDEYKMKKARLTMDFPRQHITGFDMEYTIDNPVGAVVKLETAFEPDRTYARPSDLQRTEDPNVLYREYFPEAPQKLAVSYAFTVMRPTMIRFLNPTTNFLLVGQFMHTYVHGIEDTYWSRKVDKKTKVPLNREREELVNIPGFNKYTVKPHEFKVIGVVGTSYFHGAFIPRVVGAYVHPHSGFIATTFGINLGNHVRLRLQITDFFGKDAYKGVGLFRDRDEINLRLRVQF